MNNRSTSLFSGILPRLCLGFLGLAFIATPGHSQSLGSAENFAALGASTLTNTGESHISGSVGVSPGSAITGFPPGIITNGGLHAADGPATQAHADFATAYNYFAGLPSPPANNLSGADLGGKTLTPGVYRFDTSATSGGALTFDAQGDPKARFVVQIGTTLITSSSSSVVLINGADARNVYFQVGSSATLGSGSSFTGNILAYASVTTVSGTSVTGRLLALTGGVTLDTNNVTSPGLSPAQLLNVSTRMKVQTGENVTIGGFIITGHALKKVIVRGLGPSITGVTPLLANPFLQLHGPNGSIIATNDDWKDSQQLAIQNTGLAPQKDLESAILVSLPPAGYTAVLSGKNKTTGIGMVEMYDLDLASDSQLANISTRGFVGNGNNVMIGGFIFGNGEAREKVIIRGIGPSITGVADVLADPTLELHDGDGTVLMSNDDWQDDSTQAAAISATGVQPENRREAAIVVSLAPGAYTAIVAGKGTDAGVAVAEVYHLQ